jgi:hypothetical protein
MAQTIVTLSGDDAELYKAFQRILDQQAKTEGGYKKVANASKEAADKAKAAAKEQAAEEKSRQDTIDRGLSSLAGMVTAYVSVSSAVAALTKAHGQLIENQDRALGKAKELAAAQQEAAKNLAGKTPEQISKTLQQTVPEIARETQFADLAKLTTALGSAASIVGEDKATGVVSAAAQLTKFTPESLGTTATATADIMAATGLSDAKEALALLASTGSVARPEDLAKLAQGAAAAVNAAIAQAPAQDKVDAAREGVALYAKLTAVDPSGQSAATATTDFIRQVTAVFADPKLLKERTERIETLRLGATDNQLAIQSAQMQISERERTAGFFKPEDKSAEAETARLQLAKAQQDLAQAELKSKRDAEELKRLQAIQSATAGAPDATRRVEIEKRLDVNQQLLARAKNETAVLTQQLAAKLGIDPAMGAEGVQRQYQERKAGLDQETLALGKQQGIESATVSRLTPQVKALEQQLNAKPAETFMERLAVIQQTPELRSAVTETMTGEAKFQPLFRGLLDPSSQISGGLKEAATTVTTNVDAFNQVAASTVETPQARVVEAQNIASTALAIQQATDTEGQVRAAVGQIFTDAMANTSVDMLTGLGWVGSSWFSNPISRTSDSQTAFGGLQITELQNRIQYLQNTNAPPAQIETASAAIEAINKLLVLPERLEALKTNGENVAGFLQRQNEIMEQTNILLQQSMEQNVGRNAPNNLRSMLNQE